MQDKQVNRRIKLSRELTDNDVRRVVAIELADGSDTEQWFEVCKVGKYADWRYGTLELTDALFETLKRNFDANVLQTDVALDADHLPHLGALAWINALEIRDGVLLAQFRDWTNEGKAALKQKKFKYFSIEYGPDTKVNGEDGTKVITPNVLMGIGMTNRPVVKGLKPTFLSESIQLNLGDPKPSGDKKDDHMDIKNLLMKFGRSLLDAEGGVSEADRKRFSEMYADIPEDVRDEAMNKLSADVEAKAKETAEAEANVLSEKKEKEAKRELSEKEKDEKINKLSEEVNEMKSRESARELSEAIQHVTLSKENGVGFPAAAKEKVEKFMKELSSDQRNEFRTLLSEVRIADKEKFVDLSEKGSNVTGENSDKELDVKLAEANEKAKKLAKDEGIPVHEAQSRIYEEMGLTGDAE